MVWASLAFLGAGYANGLDDSVVPGTEETTRSRADLQTAPIDFVVQFPEGAPDGATADLIIEADLPWTSCWLEFSKGQGGGAGSGTFSSVRVGDGEVVTLAVPTRPFGKRVRLKSDWLHLAPKEIVDEEPGLAPIILRPRLGTAVMVEVEGADWKDERLEDAVCHSLVVRQEHKVPSRFGARLSTVKTIRTAESTAGDFVFDGVPIGAKLVPLHATWSHPDMHDVACQFAEDAALHVTAETARTWSLYGEPMESSRYAVLSDSGEMLPDASLACTGVPDGCVVVAHGNGEFDVFYCAKARAMAAASAEGYRVGNWRWLERNKDGKPLVLALEKLPEQAVTAPTPGDPDRASSITGMVTGADGEPCENASVTLTLDTGKFRHAVTGRDGSFVFERLPPGEHLLSATAWPFRTTKAAEPAVVDRGQALIGIHLEVLTKPTLRVKLCDRHTGAALQGAGIRVEQGVHFRVWGVTNLQGVARVFAPETGEAELTSWRTMELTASQPVVYDRLRTETLVVSGASQRLEIVVP